MWGGLVWRFSDTAYVDPLRPHPNGRAKFVVMIRLRRNEQNPYLQATGKTLLDYVGDSEMVLTDPALQREFILSIPDVDVPVAHLELIENEHGRLGALKVTVVECARTLDAYRVAQTAFNLTAMGIAVRREIPLRKTSMLIARFKDEKITEFAITVPIGYPQARAEVQLAFPRCILRIYSNYAEGVASNSPFHAFLCFFGLVEFLTRDLQGRLRRFAREEPIDFEELKGTFSAEDVRHIGHFLAGRSYADVLEETRDHRNAIAHFLIGRSSRPFNVEAVDQIAFYRDALKIAARDLLVKASNNASKFMAKGVQESTLLTVFEGRFEQLSALVSALQQVQTRQ